MIVCPNCNHQNPDAAVQCEACFTPLPAMINCPSCGASVQADASFCGQCGFNLQSAGSPLPDLNPPSAASAPPDFDIVIPPPLVQPEPLVANLESNPVPLTAPESIPPAPIVPNPIVTNPVVPNPVVPNPVNSQTQLQTQVAQLLHVQTNTPVELPSTLTVIHIGKPNDRIPPDIDVSGFPHSEIVSRIHADIRVEGDIYYIEDVSSSNGTYINNAPLPAGNRHRLRPGDRIALGKGDKVTFLFQIS